MKVERRFANGTVEIKSEGDEYVISGYGAVFDQPSQVMEARGIGEFVETIDKDAFTGVLDDPHMLILANHDVRMVLGRNTVTAEVGVDEVGAWYRVRAPQSRRDIVESIERGDMFGSSFGFDIDEEEWSPGDGVAKRRLKRFKKVFDMGPVSFPAYLGTNTQVDMDKVARNYRSYLERVKEQETEGFNNLYKYRVKLLENSIII